MSNKPLAIDCVNRIKYEKVEEFKDSIFTSVYRNAYNIVGRIIKQNESEITREQEFCDENQVANVIAFLGERGMGKSSAMLSFAYFLKTFRADRPVKEYDFDGRKVSFYTLSKIDAAMLTDDENLLDVVLAKMWDTFSEKRGCGEIEELQYKETWKSFSQLKQTYAGGWKRSDKGSKLQKDSQLAELHMLAQSLNMRNNFARLVKNYLNAMYPDRDAYLVIPIDDLDLMRKMSYDVLEEIRMLFMTRRIIVLATADYSRLFLDLNNEISRELLWEKHIENEEQKKIREYTENYLGKVLPRNTRVHMPYAGKLEEISVIDRHDANIEKLYKTKPEESINITETKLVNSILLKGADILMHPIGWKGIQKTLRDIVSGLNELTSIDFLQKDLVLEWMWKEISVTNRFIDDINQRYAMESLMAISDEQIDEQMVELGKRFQGNRVYLQEYMPITDEVSYGHVIQRIIYFQNPYFGQNALSRQMIWLYSWRMQQAVKSNEERDNYTDVFNSALWALEVSAEKDKSFLNFFKELEFQGDAIVKGQEIHNLYPNVTEKNAKKIVDLFKIILLWNADEIIHTFKRSAIGETGLSVGRVLSVVGSKSIGKLQEQETEGDKDEEPKEISFTVEITEWMNNSSASIDWLIRNIPKIRELWGEYFHWIYVEIFGMNVMQEEEERKKFEENTGFEINKVTDWGISRPEDILPLQNVSVIVSAARKIGQKFGGKPIYIGDYINSCLDIIKTTFEDAETGSMYKYVCDPENSYSKKWQNIINLLKISDIDSDINKAWRVGQNEELGPYPAV